MISVITPVFNGERFLNIYRDAIKNQTLEIDKYEVILIDNGSSDGSFDLLKSMFEKHKNVNVFSYTGKQSSYAARNYGVEKSKGEILVFTDIDCQPEINWLAKIERTILEMPTEKFLLTGKVKLFPMGNSYNIYEWFDASSALNQEQYAKNKSGVTANLITIKSMFAFIGGFKEITSGADRDFCFRLTSNSDVEFYYDPDILVYHPARSTRQEIVEKELRIAKGHGELAVDLTLIKTISIFIKQVLGLIFMRNQLEIIIKTIINHNFSFKWKLNFSIFTLYCGYIYRYHYLLSLLSTIKRKIH